MKFILSLFLIQSVFAYVPTVESLFRHGQNPDVTSGAAVVSLAISDLNSSDKSKKDFIKLVFQKNSLDSYRLDQLMFENETFGDQAMKSLKRMPIVSGASLRSEPEQALFFSSLISILFNNGYHLVSTLKSQGIGVKFNNEIINRTKIDYLVSYKQYLVKINKDWSLKKTEPNPLKPEDADEKAKVDQVMNDSIYLNTGHVSYAKFDDLGAWKISGQDFEGYVSHEARQIRSLRLNTKGKLFDFHYRQYFRADGIHYVPRFIEFKSSTGQHLLVEILTSRLVGEGSDAIFPKLKKWEQVYKNQLELITKPAFLM